MFNPIELAAWEIPRRLFCLFSGDENGLDFYGDYKELYEREKLDFVAVCLPTFLHYDATMGALEHGISVLCEKPFASSVEQAAEMVKTAKQKNF